MVKPEVPPFDDMFDVWQQLWWQSPLALVLIISSLLCVLVGVYWLYRRCFNRPKRIDPYLQTQQRLQKLKSLIEQESPENAREGYCQLSEILKEYLEWHYGLAVGSKTDHELSGYLETKVIDMPELDSWVFLVESMQHHAMMAKFEQNGGVKALLADDYRKVCSIIEHTRVQAREKHQGT